MILVPPTSSLIDRGIFNNPFDRFTEPVTIIDTKCSVDEHKQTYIGIYYIHNSFKRKNVGYRERKNRFNGPSHFWR